MAAADPPADTAAPRWVARPVARRLLGPPVARRRGRHNPVACMDRTAVAGTLAGKAGRWPAPAAAAATSAARVAFTTAAQAARPSAVRAAVLTRLAAGLRSTVAPRAVPT